jgi:hypothetical protein
LNPKKVRTTIGPIANVAKTVDHWDDLLDPLPGGGELVTFRDAGDYIAKLSKSDHDRPEWQLAIKDLMRAAAGHGPWKLLARIAIIAA